MSRVYPRGPAWAARDGDVLTGELSYRPDGKKPARAEMAAHQCSTRH